MLLVLLTAVPGVAAAVATVAAAVAAAAHCPPAADTAIVTVHKLKPLFKSPYLAGRYSRVGVCWGACLAGGR
jgi:poly(3-hydroxybutyrate) depolymerase